MKEGERRKLRNEGGMEGKEGLEKEGKEKEGLICLYLATLVYRRVYPCIAALGMVSSWVFHMMTSDVSCFISPSLH